MIDLIDTKEETPDEYREDKIRTSSIIDEAIRDYHRISGPSPRVIREYGYENDRVDFCFDSDWEI